MYTYYSLIYLKKSIFTHFQYILLKNPQNSISHHSKSYAQIAFDPQPPLNKNNHTPAIHLEFLNEPLINTAIFDSTKNNLLEISVYTGNTAVDDYFKGNITLINNLLMSLAEEQIKSAFAQSEKEVQDLHTRISQGMRESKRSGKQIGLEKGTTLVTEKSIKCKEIIKKHATDFGGTLSDLEVMTLCKISRNSYYKYKRELKTTA